MQDIRNGGIILKDSPRKIARAMNHLDQGLRIPTVKLKIPGKLFLKSDPELLLHSSYSFWPKLSTSGSGWYLAIPLPRKKVE